MLICSVLFWCVFKLLGAIFFILRNTQCHHCIQNIQCCLCPVLSVLYNGVCVFCWFVSLNSYVEICTLRLKVFKRHHLVSCVVSIYVIFNSFFSKYLKHKVMFCIIIYFLQSISQNGYFKLV